MMYKNIALLLCALFVVACGGGGGGGDDGGETTSPTSSPSTTVTFDLSKFNSTSVGMVYSTNLTGSDSSGGVYTGSLALANREKEMLNGVLVTPRDLLFTITDGITPVTVNGTTYLDSGGGIIKYTIQTVGLTCTPAYINSMPLTVEVGDFDSIPTYTCSDGTASNDTTVDSSWRVVDAGNGLANIITASTTKDQFNNIIYTTEVTYGIDTLGNILGTYVMTTIAATNYTLNMSNTNSAPIIPPPPPVATDFITWIGSTNGTVVVDSTDDFFEFLYPSGLMYFGSTMITNVWVDQNSQLYFNGVNIGSVMNVVATDGSTITALISNNGYFIDFYGPESSLTWTISTKVPVIP